jgi:hypothetical protein
MNRRLKEIRSGQSIQPTLEPADLVGTIAWLIGDGSTVMLLHYSQTGWDFPSL